MARLAQSAVARAMLSAILVTLIVPVGSAQSLGRLFSSVEQRIELDEVRDEYEYGKPPKPPESGARKDRQVSAQPVIPQVTINGVVLRSSGNNASWVNGTRILSGQATPEGIRVEPRAGTGGSVRLVLPSGIDTNPIKPGQKIDVVKGTVVDAYRSKKDGKSADVFAPASAKRVDPGAADQAPSGSPRR